MNSAIIVERRLHQLRIASIEALLTLAEMMERFDVSHEEVLTLLRPGGPLVDDQAGLLARVASQRDATAAVSQVVPPAALEPPDPGSGAQLYLLTPVAG